MQERLPTRPIDARLRSPSENDRQGIRDVVQSSRHLLVWISSGRNAPVSSHPRKLRHLVRPVTLLGGAPLCLRHPTSTNLAPLGSVRVERNVDVIETPRLRPACESARDGRQVYAGRGPKLLGVGDCPSRPVCTALGRIAWGSIVDAIGSGNARRAGLRKKGHFLRDERPLRTTDGLDERQQLLEHEHLSRSAPCLLVLLDEGVQSRRLRLALLDEECRLASRLLFGGLSLRFGRLD